MSATEYPRGYLVEAVAVLQNSSLNQAILVYVCNPAERHVDAILSFLMMENIAGHFGNNWLLDESESVKRSLEKLEASDPDEWRQFLLAIKPMESDFAALKMFSPFDDDEIAQLAA